MSKLILPRTRTALDTLYIDELSRVAELRNELVQVQKGLAILYGLSSGWRNPYGQSSIDIGGSSIPSACHFLLNDPHGNPVVAREFIASSNAYVYSCEYSVAKRFVGFRFGTKQERLAFPVLALDAVMHTVCTKCGSSRPVVGLFQYTGTHVDRKKQIYPPQHREYFNLIESSMMCCQGIVAVSL